MTMVLRSIEKWLGRCEALLVFSAVLATAAMMCLTSVDAASRYLFNRPITGAYEITEKYLMVAAVFLGFSYAYRGGCFIRVTFLIDRLPAPLKLLANYMAQIISLLYSLLFCVATARQGLLAASEATTLSAVPVPVGPAYLLVPVGFFAMAVLMLVDLPRVRTGESHLFADDAPNA
jgi:TRAP-type C4-dicarboxylate transport system permease small subunit